MIRRGTIIAFLAIFLGRVDAQAKGGAQATTTPDNTPQQTATDDPGQTDNPTGGQSPTPVKTGDNNDSSSTSSASTTQTTSPTDLPNVSSANGLPQLSSSAPLPSLATALPHLTQNQANIPSYQVVIPQVNGNPFLQTSSFPEGTVFIIVGSVLAGLALMLIASRAIYIWCLYRQTKQGGKDVKYSEMEQRPYTAANGGPATVSLTGGNNISLDYLRPGDRTSRVSSFSSRPSSGRPSTARPSTARPSTGRPQTSSLRPVSTGTNPLSSSGVQFYSPSAHPGGATAAALGTQSSRDSGYLPAGFYLREASTVNNSTAQMYNASNATNSAFLYSDSSTPPITRLSRTTTSNSNITNGIGNGNGNGNGNARPTTSAPGSAYGGGGRPISGYSSSQQGQQGYSQPRRAPSSNGETYAGDRRSKPSQVLEDLLGGG
jgi:hypothetical protein